MIVQFYIYYKGTKYVYKIKRNGTCMCNNTTITKQRYDSALEYFNSNR